MWWLPLLLLSLSCLLSEISVLPISPFKLHGSFFAYAAPAPTSLLDVFQVTTPVGNSYGLGCSQTLMEHVFANSYGEPFIGLYIPPPCYFNRVVFRLTVTSAGRQFDRLGLMYFNDTEIFRTSAAEPTQNGIVWTYSKDMSNYFPLFCGTQKIIFDLGNLVNEIYTAPFYTTLTATFSYDENAEQAADVILPVSARLSAFDKPSAFQISDANRIASNSLTLPRNVKRAMFTISGTGQSQEEFWWSNVLSSDTATFGDMTTLHGHSPFREIQLYIDGSLAGVAWPFPVIFTGGVAPEFWSPVVGISAFDLPEEEIDISPFLPLLCDGTAHTFEIRVAGIADDGRGNGALTNTVGSYWIVTGKVFLFLGAPGSVTTGFESPVLQDDTVLHLSSDVRQFPDGTNETLAYEVMVTRHVSVSSTITTSDGTRSISWVQSLRYSNVGNVTDRGKSQDVHQTSDGVATSEDGYSNSFSYPLRASFWYTNDSSNDNPTFHASIDRGKDETVLGRSVFPTGVKYLDRQNTSAERYTGSTLHTRQNGTSMYRSLPGQSQAFCSSATEQEYKFSGLLSDRDAATELYRRHVLAVNGTVAEDEETVVGDTERVRHAQGVPGEQQCALAGIRQILGRIPPR